MTVTEADATLNVVNVYDSNGRITHETSNGETHQHFYDALGNLRKTIYGGTGTSITSTYDAHARLDTMTERSAAPNSSDRVTSYRYDSAGNVIDKVLPNGETHSNSFNPAGRRSERIVTLPDGTYLSQQDYQYDKVGNLRNLKVTSSVIDNQETTNVYDNGYRLQEETIVTRGTTTKTTYGYDDSGNRETKSVNKDGTIEQWDYRYNDLNQLQEMDKPSGDTITFSYDTNGNRKTKSGPGNELLEYLYDHENRLISVHESGSTSSNEGYHYGYDHRTRNVTRDEAGIKTDVVFLGGLSVVEYEGTTPWIIPDRTEPTVEYVRGSDWGGGIGGILYTTRDGQPSYNHYNGRGDVVAKTDDSGSLTYQATYEAYGTRIHEDGNNEDRQRANTKDESPWGGLNEGMRWRDLETGVWLTRDPAGFVDGPNVYTYVRQNPWTSFDPLGLETPRPYGTPAFRESFNSNLKAERAESVTSDKIFKAVEALPNPVVYRANPKTKGETFVRFDGTVIVSYDPARLDKSTLTHEAGHVIVKATEFNLRKELTDKGQVLTGEDMERTTKAASDALNKIVPVASALDEANERDENEPSRISNIVNIEREAHNQPQGTNKDQLLEKMRTNRKIVTKHQHNNKPIPKGTEFGGYDFKPVEETLKSKRENEKSKQ